MPKRAITIAIAIVGRAVRAVRLFCTLISFLMYVIVVSSNNQSIIIFYFVCFVRHL